MRLSIIPFILLLIPLAEIAAFVIIGGQIGVWPTLGIVLVTAIIGSSLLRWQGIGLFNRINAEIRANRVPGRELVHGVMILIAGVLLLTPGFITDTLGFLLFVPAIRDLLWRFVKNRVQVQTMAGGFTAHDFENSGFGQNPRHHHSRDDVVDLNADEYQRQADPASPWSENKAELPRPDTKKMDEESDRL